MEAEQSMLLQEVELIKFNYNWTINNFSFYDDAKTGSELRSPTFSSGARDKLKWRLEVLPKGANDACMGYLSIFIRLVSGNETGVQAKYKLSIVNAEGKKTMPKTRKDTFAQGEALGFPKFIWSGSLFDEARGFLSDDKLAVYSEMSVVANNLNINDVKVPKCRLADDYSSLLDTPRFADVTLHVRGREFPAHKSILSARSPVFAAMFMHGMKEQKDNRVEIPDIKPEVFKEMLQFVYSGRTSNLNDMAEDLLIAANKYALERLKSMCEEALTMSLSVDNVVETLMLADVYSAHQLKEQAITFINTHTADVMETEGWKLMTKTHLQLIIEAYRALATDGPPRKKQRMA